MKYDSLSEAVGHFVKDSTPIVEAGDAIKLARNIIMVQNQRIAQLEQYLKDNNLAIPAQPGVEIPAAPKNVVPGPGATSINEQ